MTHHTSGNDERLQSHHNRNGHHGHSDIALHERQPHEAGGRAVRPDRVEQLPLRLRLDQVPVKVRLCNLGFNIWPSNYCAAGETFSQQKFKQIGHTAEKRRF